MISLTTPAIDEFILPHLYFRQYLSIGSRWEIGKLDTTRGDANESAHGRGNNKFMNIAFSFNPVAITLAPYAPLGIVCCSSPTKMWTIFSVIDTQGLPNTAGFKTLIEDPTTLTHEARATVRLSV